MSLFCCCIITEKAAPKYPWNKRKSFHRGAKQTQAATPANAWNKRKSFPQAYTSTKAQALEYNACAGGEVTNRNPNGDSPWK